MKKYVNGTLTELSASEVEQLELQEAAYAAEEGERRAFDLRTQRDQLLKETDWMALSDNTMTPEWASYRQALRDVTDQAGFPASVTWPTKP